jgi:hypothetical protein
LPNGDSGKPFDGWLSTGRQKAYDQAIVRRKISLWTGGGGNS